MSRKGVQYRPLKGAPRSTSPGGGRGGLQRWLKLAGACLVVLPWVALALLLGYSSLLRGGRGAYQDLPGGKQCVGWRETYFCHPFAERYAPGDKGCDDVIIPQISGYCLCEGNITAARSSCGPKRFTCRQKCMELAYNPTDALVLPTPISCPYDVPYILSDYLGAKMTPAPANWTIDAAAKRAAVEPAWDALQAAVHAHSIANASTPGTRNLTHDFVREGAALPRSVVSDVRAALDGFRASIPAYPAAAFSGRGIVMVGGGLRYVVPAWISVHQLRHLGCQLPIEMWYPMSEYPASRGLIDAFAALGVVTRPLDLKGLDIPEPFAKDRKDGAAAAGDPENMARFTIKVAALVLSSFEEIIYLDVDNIPVRDPTYLLDDPEYTAAGALLWQDFWANTVAPQAEEMLGVPRARWYAGSFESGQMVVDKRRHWRGLATAAYLNSYAAFWYEVFTCYLGKGDKETFAYGMLAAGEGWRVVAKPPSSLGTVGTSMDCSPRTKLCRDEFTGNTMVQFDPRGQLLFLHSNLHKWDMRLPENFGLHYQRRWLTLQPEGHHWETWAQRNLGYDLERKVYDLVRMLRCQPWWDAYYEARVREHHDRATPDLDGWHYLLRGIEFDRIYRQGWRGNYLSLVTTRSLSARLRHWFQGNVRPSLLRLGLSRRGEQ